MPRKNEAGSKSYFFEAHAPLLPAIEIVHPATLDLDPIAAEFQLVGAKRDAKTGDALYSLSIRQFESRASRRHKDLIIPEIVRSNRNSMVFELGLIRWLSPSESELLVDSRVAANRTYFANLIRPIINHAAGISSSVLLHAALAQWRDIGVLMPGGSGKGKTTLALLAALQGEKVVTDDLALLGLEGERHIGISLRGYINVRNETFALLPDKMRETAVEGMFLTEKKHSITKENIENITIASSEINVILFPSISREVSKDAFRLEKLSKTDALINLLQNTDPIAMAMMDKSTNSRMIDSVKRLVKNSVCLQVTTTAQLFNQPEKHICELVDEVHAISKRS